MGNAPIEYIDATKQKIYDSKFNTFRNLPPDYYNTTINAFNAISKYSPIWFACMGTFNAKILNQYHLRFCHGIFFEDMDFGSILFMLKGKFYYHSYQGYYYRIRLNSITTATDNPTKEYIPNLPTTKEYFKIYCYAKIGINIHKASKILINNSDIQRRISINAQDFIIYNYFNSNFSANDLGNIISKLKQINLYKTIQKRIACLFIKECFRHPLKIYFKITKFYGIYKRFTS